MKMVRRKKGQIWVETVVYTLIGLAIIGLLLSIVKPAIDEKKDQILIESSLEMLEQIENEIEDVKYRGVGNSRIVSLKIEKGNLEINPVDDFLKFSMDSRYEYSQPGQEVEMGKIKILTTEKTEKNYLIDLTLDYRGWADLTYNNQETGKSFQPAKTPYSLTITNLGKTEEFVQIDFS